MSQHLRIDSSPWIAGRLIVGDGSLGILGSEIPVTGEVGGSIFENDFTVGDEAKEFRALLITPPAGGSFSLFPDGSFSFDAPALGTYSFTYQLYVDGAAVDTPKTASLTVGVPTAALAATLGAAVFAGTGAGTTAGASAGTMAVTLQAATFAASGVGYTAFPYGSMAAALGDATFAGEVSGFAPVQYSPNTRTWDEMVRIIALDVAECPEIAIVEKLRLAAREFCIRSWAWREDLDPLETIELIDEYRLPLPAGAVMVQVLTVKYDGVEIDPGSDEGLEELLGDLDSLDPGRPGHYLSPHIGSIRLVPRPALSGGRVTVKAALAPTFDAIGLPDFLVDRWGETIMAKARALLFRMDNRPWSDSASATDFETQFNASVGSAKGRAARANTRARTRVRGTNF